MTIRIATEQDAAALLAIYAPYVEKTAITFEYAVPSATAFAERIRRTVARYPYLVAEADGEAVGYAYAGFFHERAAYGWAAETSVYVRMDRRRQGIGGSLYAALEELLKRQGILNLNACIAHSEKADAYLPGDSVAFHERQGYRLAGEFHACGYKFNRWYHMIWMEKHIGLHRQYQPEVRPFEELRAELSGQDVWQFLHKDQ